MAKKILSFEEYATNQGLGDKTEVSEEDLDDCPCGHDEEGNCKECEEGGEPEPEEEIEDDSDDDSDEDDSDDDDSDDDDDDDDDDSEEAPEEAEGEEVGTETVATVEEMLTEGYNKVKEAACAYENDEYQDHTLEMYMKENAALVAALAAKSMEEGYDEVKETDMTQEMYEALCNEMQESYCKKIEELKEAYSAGKE
jgi:hypothetical protein|tara:strand:- start:137 stop:727 length:591 start_codon:yes stop_codon:yes gene_type:complete